jgi:secretion/DNA translocation related CpaE-like protein
MSPRRGPSPVPGQLGFHNPLVTRPTVHKLSDAVAVKMPPNHRWRMKTAHIIGVVGGSGGVGASVLTAAIAVRAAHLGLSPACLDGDRLGGGLDVTLGIEQERGVRWPDLARARGRIDGSELLRRLPAVDGVSVLSFDRGRDVELGAETAVEVLHALRAAADLVVLDLPRPDHELFRALAPEVDAMVLLAGSGIGDLAGASAIAGHLIRACHDVWLCLRTSGHGSHFADTVAGALDLPMLAVVGEEASLPGDLLHGIPPGSSAGRALAAAADRILDQCVTGARLRAS